MQGYRNEGLQTSKFFDAGIVPKGRYFRLFIISSWTGVYGKETEGGGVPEQVVLTEVQFYGRQIQLGLTGIDREACSYGYIYNRDTGECKLAGWLKLLNININIYILIYYHILNVIYIRVYNNG